MKCRVCDSTNLEMVIDLGLQPWGNNFLKKEEVGSEPFYPLRVLFCNDCSTSQLDYTVKKEVMFGDHTYLSGVTKSLSAHFKRIAIQVDDLFCKNKPKKTVLDIGSNDGTQLQHFKELGYSVTGVESSKTTSEIANKSGINTINDYFNYELVKKNNLLNKFDIINASGVFFHLEELHSVTKGIKASLKKNGVFVVQFLYMKNIIENNAFDQIYHEHLLYYTLKTIEILLNRHDLSMFDAYVDEIHGGSVIGYVTHKGRLKPSERLSKLREDENFKNINDKQTYLDFYERIKKMKRENIDFLEKAKKQGKTIYGMGAPVKGNTMLNYFGIGTKHIDYLVEINKLRKNLFSPGSHIPIVIEEELDNQPDIYFVFAWNFKKEILEKNKELIESGVEFYFPVNPEKNKQ
jgi:2-polyprenyl-3-methyl-5-hydroxy-6-metoxy-1,4-benzoquinol methylase